jgi:phosphoglycolate phosphatase-like HAD superfamily hydrolase
MRKKVALFDFDGTIAASVKVGVAVFNEMAREYGFSEITPENIPALRAKSARQVARELGIPRLKIPMVVRRLRKGLKKRIATVKPVAGIKPILFALKRNGCELGIVTSNSKANVLTFLKKNKLEIFDYIRAGRGIFYKATAIRRTIARNHLESHETIYVGDEIRDVIAARKNKITAIAVTWGTNSRKGLEKENADFVVDTADELATILSDFCEIN